jgi:DNA-directed RNA polymerase subunit N (RpoN/RPB10)
MSETIENKEITPTKNNNSVLATFKNEFASSLIPVYVNSLKREVNFKEVSVVDQKALSKTMIQNENRKDIVYDTQCALINKVCMEDGFSIYNLTEFDRIRILMEIYSSNYFQEAIEYKCPECGCLNSYTLDFDKILKKFNAFDLEDVKFTIEDRQRVYVFTLNYPSVRAVSDFYKNYMKNYRNTTKKE